MFDLGLNLRLELVWLDWHDVWGVVNCYVDWLGLCDVWDVGNSCIDWLDLQDLVGVSSSSIASLSLAFWNLSWLFILQFLAFNLFLCPWLHTLFKRNIINFLCTFPLICNVNFGCDFWGCSMLKQNNKSNITGMQITVQLT